MKIDARFDASRARIATAPDHPGDAIGPARAMLLDEAEALSCLARRIDHNFAHACALILAAQGRLVVGGLGKSGHIARKIAATFTSTGTPASFLHLAEALHGDLGSIRPGDVALLISHSGETAELLPIIGFLENLDIPLIGISANPGSPLLLAAAAPIALPKWKEVGPGGLAPTTSTLMALAVGDALAMTVMDARGFGHTEFQRLHPGGAIGSRLRPVSAVMHRDGAIPLVSFATPMMEAVIEMTAKRLGIVGVIDDEGVLAGVITDGDLRRNLDRLPHVTAGEIMSHHPRIIPPETLVEDARALFSLHKITSLFVVDDPAYPRPLGIIHIHDLSFALSLA